MIYFSIDTVPPSLLINSPFNQSYAGNITLSIQSSGSLVLYNIQELLSTNQTYTESIVINLPIGHYFLIVYAFDNVGNIKVEYISFSIVASIELLLNPYLDRVDQAGNYIVGTQINLNPDFVLVGLLLNGTFYGELSLNTLDQEYQLDLQLPYPGIWCITLYANTTADEYDFAYFQEIWMPPESISTESSRLPTHSSYTNNTSTNVKTDVSDFVTISIAGSLTAVLVTIGNVYTRRRRL